MVGVSLSNLKVFEPRGGGRREREPNDMLSKSFYEAE